jgi:serine/threonine protein kinase
MMQTAHPSFAAAEAARQRADRAEAIKQAWRDGQRPDAAAVLNEDPDIAGDRAVALDLAYEEFCVREEAGEVLDSSTFCDRFPFGASLRRLLTLHRFLDDHPDVLDDVPTSWPNAGETLGDFLLLRELGRGSFSRVYLAVEATAGGRPVALKVTSAGSHEADTLGPLSHPHLIPVLSSRRVGPWTTVAMPFAGTATLEDILSAVRPPTPPLSAALILEACAAGRLADDPPFPFCPAYPIHAEMTYGDALSAVAAGLFAAVAHLHERGIAHRDIKPSNVLIGPNGHPYLLDFNLASRVADPWRVVGTLPYMAPEQLALLAKADATPPVDGRPADVFACGVLLFELLTGRHPFGDSGGLPAHSNREQVAAALLAAQRAGPPSLSALNSKVRRTVRVAIERCLALDARERPSAAELVELFSRTKPRRTRRLAASVLAGAGVLALVLGFAFPTKPVPAPDVIDPAPPVTALASPSPLERGLVLARQGEHRLAAAEFLSVGSTEKGSHEHRARAYGYAAYCLAAGRDPKGAVVAADEAIRLGDRTAAVYANRAFGHRQAGRLAEAKRDCDEALRRDPTLLAACYTRADVYLQLYHRDSKPIPLEAIADIEQVTASSPTAPDVWLAAAQLYLLTSDGGTIRQNDAAKAVRKAVLAGRSPEVIGRNAVLRNALANNPIYQEALSLRPTAGGQSVNPHLANPLP